MEDYYFKVYSKVSAAFSSISESGKDHKREMGTRKKISFGSPSALQSCPDPQSEGHPAVNT